MIVTKIDELDSFSEVPFAREIMDFISDFKKGDMAPGRYEIHGDDLFANVGRYDTEPVENRRFEGHRKYIDLQIVLDGHEEIHWAPVDTLKMTDDGFSNGGDCSFFDGESLGCVILGGDQCAVLFENDAHKPNVMHKKIENVLKIVFKIKKDA